MEKMIFPIQGMHCKSCEITLEDSLKQVKGIKRAQVSHVSGKAKIWYESSCKPSEGALSSAVESAGYVVGRGEDKKEWLSSNSRNYKYLFLAAIILFVMYVLGRGFGIDNIASGFNQKSIATAGVIGLVAGVSSCMALIGGLVLALSARHAELHPEATTMQKFRPHIFFNLGRILGFALLGGMIGLIGGAMQPSIKLLSVLTLIVGAVMILLGLKLLEIFPILDRISLTLPKAISRKFGITTETKEYSHKGALMGGVLSFFLPCGFTQAMQLYAISTGSFTQGALIMSLFAIGTAPGLLGIGGLSAALKGTRARLYFATAGLAVVVLGWYNISNASRIVFPRNDAIEAVADSDSNGASQGADTQVIKTTYTWDKDIEPRQFTVKAGKPVNFLVDVKDEGSGCMSTIMIPGLYNNPLFLEGGQQLSMQFTPKKKGSYPITCAMGIKRGYLKVE